MDNIDPAELVPLSGATSVGEPIADCILITKVSQSKVETSVLRTICFWHPKAKTERGGHRWVIKSAEEFIEEGNLYKADTIWRAIRALAKRGVLITERHFHPYRPIRGPVLWIRPSLPLKDDTKQYFYKPKKQPKGMKGQGAY